MKKLLSLMLVLIMVLSLFAGCGKTEAPAQTEEPAKTEETKKEEPKKEEEKKEEAAAPSWQEEHPTWLCEEKTTLKVYTYDGVNATYLPPSNDLWFWQQLEEYTNVHIEWEIVPYVDYGTLVQTKMAAGGNMPDILNVDTAANAMSFGQNGLLLDMAPYWDECFPNAQAYFEANNFPFKANITLTEAGEIFGIPTLTPVRTRNPRILLFNQDWMDRLGLENPSTIDELTEVLRAMKAAGDMNGNGEADEIVLTSASLDTIMAATNAAFGKDIYTGANYATGEDGVVYPVYTADNQKAQLEWLAMLYEEGILDPEICVMTADLQSQKIAADQVGVVAYYASFVVNFSKLTSIGQADPSAAVYNVGLPMTSEFTDAPYMITDASYSNFTAVTTDCENPELACKWIDTLYTDPVVMDWRRLGPEGICWEIKDGEMVLCYNEDGTTVSVNTYGAGQLALCWIHPEENWSYKFTRPWFLEAYKPFEEVEWKDPSVPKLPGKTDFEKELYDTYYTDVNDGWKEYRDKFVTGELDIETDWDTYVETMDALGMNELTACYQSTYDRFMAAN